MLIWIARKKLQGGLDGTATVSITHTTGSTDCGRSAKQDGTPESKPCFKGSQTKRARVLHVTQLHNFGVYVQREKVKKQSHRMRSCSQKEIRRKLQFISKAVYICSGQGPSRQPSIMGFGRAVSSMIVHCPSTCAEHPRDRSLRWELWVSRVDHLHLAWAMGW